MRARLLIVATVIFALLNLGLGVRPLIASALFNIANLSATKTLFGDDDHNLMLSLRAHDLAQTWLPDANRSDLVILASLRAADSCTRREASDVPIGDTVGSLQAWLAWQGKCMWLKGNLENALDAWGRYPIKPFFLRLARYEQGRGNPDDALETYSMLLDLDPNDAEAWLGRGRLSELAMNWDQAEQAYETAIRLAPYSASAHQTLANYRWLRGMKDARTEQLLLRAIDLSTTSAECMNGSSLKAGYGLSYSRSWRLTLAQEEQTLVALKCFRNLPWLYSDLAHYYLITNRAALAEQAAREVVRLDSKIYFGYLFLGEALFLRGNLGESVLAYERALGAGGRNMEIFVGLAQANLRLGQYSQARKYALQLISTYPNQTDFRLVSLNPMDDDFQLLLDEVEKQRASQSGN